MTRRPVRSALAALAALALLAGCERTLRDMYQQPRLDRDAGSPLFDDGKASRPPPPGSIPAAVGDLAATSGGRRGADELAARDAADAAPSLPPLTRTLLLRGQDRFDVFCAPCHSPLGDGDGLVVRRGFPHPPSFHQARLREAPDRHFFDVMTQGYGVMPSYADRVSAPDRWAIVAYVRALQLSQAVPFAQLPRSEQQALDALRARAPTEAK
jgi:mono/diheme cytochrome c family protein